MQPFLKIASAVALACCATVPLVAAMAADLSSRPITLVSPFPPGGGTDTLTRMVASGLAEAGERIAQRLGQSVVVENKPGAGGNLALDSTARAQPDGHTLVMAQTDNIVLNPWLYKKLTYDTFEDFKPVGLVASSPSVFVVIPDSPFKTIDDVARADGLGLVPWIPTLKYNYVEVTAVAITGRAFRRGVEPERYGISDY